ncbi:SlyX family protein [Alisedimentitalea sp. MJ-SS2]|uniref:SlyX family protein n=1 Tax=Aliisedimentitalea sp. MJ-SS2 TaxID=3049795 RepID=UPI002907C958|nr:SlyX family protein [Alisedimentitalea sp. MJ-SS2]MDU8928502.1 SlyX family protein [Alisedimentitalea sp. MJ-SS2]
MSSDDRTQLEEAIAHLTRVTEELSDVIARQEGEIAVLKRRVEMLMRREGEREAAGGSSHVFAGDEPPPPHY